MAPDEIRLVDSVSLQSKETHTVIGKDNIKAQNFLSSKGLEREVQEQVLDAVPEAGNARCPRDLLHLGVDERHDILDRAEKIKARHALTASRWRRWSG